MNPGKYNQLISILLKDWENNEFKDTLSTSNEVFKCYAYVNNISGYEYWEAMQNNAENTVIFTVRYNFKTKDIDALKHDILFREEVYNILTVDNFKYANRDIKIKAIKKGVTHDY